MADEDKPEYAVGFGKPPRRTRFCKGQSGNPKGRPRGARNLATLMEKVLKEPVVISENGKRRRITKREALIKQLVRDVVERQDRSVLVAHALDGQRALAAVTVDQHVRFGLLAAHELVELG